MDRRMWNQGWRLWSPRSYADAVDTRNGDRVSMRLRHRGRGVSLDRFGPNVGQPNPRPPVHPKHRDLPELASGLKLGCWTRDGCYAFELDRPEARVKVILADSRSLACGPTNDPVLRQGVLICRVDCERLDDNVELSFQARAVGDEALRVIPVQGEATLLGQVLRLRPGRTFFTVGRMAATPNQAKVLKRARQMDAYVTHFGRAQLTGPQRMGHAVRWNLCFDRGQQRTYLAVTRSWVEMMAINTGLDDCRRGPLIFGWDSALSALLVARSDPAVAADIVRSVLARQQPDGRLPTLSLGPHDGDRMAPPLLPLAVWYLCHDREGELVAEWLPSLLRAHRWMMEHRHPRADGLLCWGDDAVKTGPLRVDGWAGAAYESGLDNSPMWEDLGYDPERRCMGRGSVDLSSMAALSARVLAALCRRVGEDPIPLEEDYRRIRRAVNERLWGTDGLYHNLTVDGRLSRRISPTSFYPMVAGIPPRDRALRMIKEHLRGHGAFWGHPVLPSVPRADPAYDGDGDYWRGRIWPPMNYLVWAGLRQYDPAQAAHLADHSRLLFDDEWERHGHVHENYSAVTGQGEPRPGVYARSAPLYGWGGLLLLPDVEGKTACPINRLPVIE